VKAARAAVLPAAGDGGTCGSGFRFAGCNHHECLLSDPFCCCLEPCCALHSLCLPLRSFQQRQGGTSAHAVGGRGAGRAIGGGGAAEALVAVAHQVGRPLHTTRSSARLCKLPVSQGTKGMSAAG
jgi:hypothetical protein